MIFENCSRTVKRLSDTTMDDNDCQTCTVFPIAYIGTAMSQANQ